MTSDTAAPPTIRVTFEVNQSQLFDTLHKMGGDTRAIGERIIGVLLSGECSWPDEVGMAVYGITLHPKDSGGA